MRAATDESAGQGIDGTCPSVPQFRWWTQSAPSPRSSAKGRIWRYRPTHKSVARTGPSSLTNRPVTARLLRLVTPRLAWDQLVHPEFVSDALMGRGARKDGCAQGLRAVGELRLAAFEDVDAPVAHFVNHLGTVPLEESSVGAA